MALGSSITLRNRLAQFLGYSHEGNRDLYEAFGYKRTLKVEDLTALYRRNDIASRIIRAFPQATWRNPPVVRDEAGDNPEDSEFVAAWEDFAERHKVWHYLERADRLSGIGSYSVLLMGFRDTAGMQRPMGRGQAELLFLQPYGEEHAKVDKWVTDTKQPRYGLPERYTLQQGQPTLGGSVQTTSLPVHWTRVIHIAEGTDENEVYGMPRLLPVYNRLKDMEKVVGASAETFWLNARPGMGLFAHKDAEITDDQIDAMKDQADEFEHELRRIFIGQGITPHMLATAIADPKATVETQIMLIAGAVGIPQRILIGSERGELASEQDENNWAARIDERRRGHATFGILKPFVQMMIDTGNLPEPRGEWFCEWPEPALSEKDMADIANVKSQAIATYANSPNAAFIVPPQEFRPMIGLEPESEFELPEELAPLPEDDEEGGDDPNAEGREAAE